MTNGQIFKMARRRQGLILLREMEHTDGLYVYRTIFFLDTTDPSTAVLRVKWAIDNDGLDIVLNGVLTRNKQL